MKESFKDIAKVGSRITVKEDKYLFYRGDVGNDFFIIEQGKVELSIFDFKGEKVILAELGEGDFFGQVEIFTNGIRPTNAYAFRGAVLKSFSANMVVDFLRAHNDQAIHVIKVLCSMIDRGVEKIEDSLVLNAYQKVGKKIYELGELYGSKHIAINQKRISEFLSLSERTTNISLNRLKAKGAIAVKRSRIVILDDRLLKQEFSYNEDAA